MHKLTIDITSKCNLDCSFCYQGSKGALSPEYILSHVDGYNPRIVEIGGGEPLLYSNFSELLGDLAERGKQIRIATNGTVLPEMENWPKNQILMQVSLPALDPKLYEKITGKNLVNRVTENIKKFGRNFRTAINVPLYKDNFGEVGKIADFAKKNDIRAVFGLVVPVGKAKNLELLDEKQIRELKRYAFEQVFSGAPVDCGLIHHKKCQLFENYYNIPKTEQCPVDAGEKIYIAPNGQIGKCEFIREGN